MTRRTPFARARSARVTTRSLALALTGTVLLAGCARLPTTTAPAPTDRQPLAVEPVQATRVVAAATAVLQAGADPATADPAALAARVSGPELALRTAAHAVAAAGAQAPTTNGADDFTPLTSILPRTRDFPRWFATVTAPGADRSPSLVVLRSASAREPYTAWATPSLLPGASLPTLAAPADGVAVVADDEGTNLPLSPRAVAEHYADVLTAGDDSPHAGEFGPDGYRDGVRSAVAADTAAVQGAGGTFTQERSVLPDGVLAVRTREGGALVVAGYTWTTTLTIPPGATSGTLEPAFAALAGRAQGRTTAVERQSVVVFAVPPGQGTVQAVAVESGLVRVTAS
ncbi:hypothetical protein [Kineococcus aurantiacus]|uniref:DUF8094 domain-containing protein n=1 Tax=Kineococcus aurantiacus TaxID=37633 RepID=A0A7Y9DPB5_9ACTN|nr:hypothetical protein [Kineococcus aurantiacus]NYD24136.1 hypothetical protein [Kineococcus aurantiacus]